MAGQGGTSQAAAALQALQQTGQGALNEEVVKALVKDVVAILGGLANVDETSKTARMVQEDMKGKLNQVIGTIEANDAAMKAAIKDETEKMTVDMKTRTDNLNARLEPIETKMKVLEDGVQ